VIQSLALLVPAVAVAAPVGIGAGIYFHELAPRDGWLAYVGSGLSGLSEASPLLAGLALLAAGVSIHVASAGALALVLIPRLHRATHECLSAVDPRLRRSGEALGASEWEAVATLVLPRAAKPLLGRVLREIARAAGEAAPLIVLAASDSLAVQAIVSPVAAGALVLGVFLANLVAVYPMRTQ
jgi:phosphate transport system permease protein